MSGPSFHQHHFPALVVGRAGKEWRLQWAQNTPTKSISQENILNQNSKKPHPPTNVEPVGTLDFVHGEIRTEIFGRNGMLNLLLLLFFLLFVTILGRRIIILDRIQDKGQRFAGGESVAIHGMVGNFDLHLSGKVWWES